jgi:ABC-type transporter Mla subunit MlaD
MSPTIDTLINTFSLFATMEIGAFVLIGSFIVWNGFALRERAEKDLDKIEETKARTEELEEKVQTIFNQTKSTLTTLTAESQGIREVVNDLQTRLEQVDIKDRKITALLSDLEQRASTYTNTLQGSASVLNSPSLASSSQPAPLVQSTYPLVYPTVYANPIAQPPTLQKTRDKLMDYLMSDAVPLGGSQLNHW